LYPCSRYSADRCFFCGGSFRDHLTLWWSKHLYAPFDRILDRIHDHGMEMVPSEEDVVVSRRNSRTIIEPKLVPRHTFHRRYVLEVGALRQGAHNQRQKKKLMERAIDEHPLLAGPMEKKSVMEVSYVIPALASNDGIGPEPSLTLRFVRATLLRAVEALIYLEEADNAKS
jgi:hypothetical protein